MNKFYTKHGFLTKYALACGYLETSQNFKHNYVNDAPYLTLSYDCIYHVKGRPNLDQSVYIWESFNSYKDAKAFFMYTLKKCKLKRHINKCYK